MLVQVQSGYSHRVEIETLSPGHLTTNRMYLPNWHCSNDNACNNINVCVTTVTTRVLAIILTSIIATTIIAKMFATTMLIIKSLQAGILGWTGEQYNWRAKWRLWNANGKTHNRLLYVMNTVQLSCELWNFPEITICKSHLKIEIYNRGCLSNG